MTTAFKYKITNTWNIKSAKLKSTGYSNDQLQNLHSLIRNKITHKSRYFMSGAYANLHIVISTGSVVVMLSGASRPKPLGMWNTGATLFGSFTRSHQILVDKTKIDTCSPVPFIGSVTDGSCVRRVLSKHSQRIDLSTMSIDQNPQISLRIRCGMNIRHQWFLPPKVHKTNLLETCSPVNILLKHSKRAQSSMKTVVIEDNSFDHLF